jgi:hypothetical protein
MPSGAGTSVFFCAPKDVFTKTIVLRGHAKLSGLFQAQASWAGNQAHHVGHYFDNLILSF